MPDLFIRNMDADAIARIKRAATMRGMTLPQYIAALSLLHDAARAHADAGDTKLQAELEALGLQTVKG